MSNFDERGAYTPREEPLAFDARQPGGRGGGRPPVTLIISAAVLVLLAAGVFFYYRSGVRHQGDAPRVLGQPVGEMTSAPPSSAQPSDTAGGLAVYNTEQAPASDTAPQFAPQPEQPMARPAPPPVQPAPQPQPTVRTLPPAPTAQPAAATRPPAAPAATPTPKPVAANPKTSPDTAPATPMMTAAAGNTTRAPAALAAAHAPSPAPAVQAAAPKPAAGASGPAVVQIGAFTTAAQADKGWQDVARLVPGSMAGHGKRVEPVTVGGKVFQRTYVTGFASKDAAKAFCAKLSAAGHSCIVR